MKFTPFQLGLLAVGSFASIVLLNVLAKYQSNEEFRGQLASLKPADLLSLRNRVISEERMEAPAPEPVTADTGDFGEISND